MRLIDRTGDRYARLTVLERLPAKSKTDTNARWFCRCDCGRSTVAYGGDLERGKVKSCGCLNAERIMQHGMSQLPVYAVWQAMVQRCTNPNHNGYRNYGGRISVTVCERWRRDPWAFAEDIYREIGPRPEGRDENGRVLYELDRTNNDRGYWCGRCAECAGNGQDAINVRWSDKVTQRANQRTIADLTRERDALAAELAALRATLV